MRKKRETLGHGAVFLDPKNVGSSIRWVVTRRVATYAEVIMSDCDRHITWSGYGRDGLQQMRQKIKAALEEFRLCDEKIAEVMKRKLVRKKRSK
jgi:hypothetical protein